MKYLLVIICILLLTSSGDMEIHEAGEGTGIEGTSTESSCVKQRNTSQYSKYTQELTKDEQNIADALIKILNNLHDITGMEEYPEFYSFEDSAIKVTYFQGYIWRSDPLPNEELLQTAPVGICCFLPVPEQAENQPRYFVINVGRKDDGKYYNHIYGWYSDSRSLDSFFQGRPSYFPIEDYSQTFKLYIPPNFDIRCLP